MARDVDSADSTNYWLAYFVPGAALVAVGPAASSPVWLSVFVYTLATALLVIGLVQGVRQKVRARSNARPD